jgi:hypothetical protein
MGDIRRELDKEYESMSVEIKPFREMFLGDIVGMVLRPRHEKNGDQHVIFQIISEDDGHWFLSTSGVSSSWFEDYGSVLAAARKWCEENCDPDISHGRQFGWKFRKE